MYSVYEFSLADTQNKKKFKTKLVQRTKNEANKPKKEKKKEKEGNIRSQKAEEQLREFIGFFRNQLVEKDPRKARQSQEDLVDGFLNSNEYDEIKRNYDDYRYGDIVIQFPNPDKKELFPNRGINFKYAEQCFDNMLTVLTDEGFSKAQLKLEREAFLYSFLLLKDFEQGKKIDSKKKKKKKKRRDKQKKVKQVKDDKPKNDYQKFLEAIKMLEDKQNEALMNEDVIVKNEKKNEELIQDIDLWNMLIKINLGDIHQFKSVQKCFSDGGYMYLKEYEDDDDTDWVCYNSQPRDFLTLIRFTILTKFCRNANLHCRQFISLDGNHIFMVIKANEDVIRKEAESAGQTKQLEIGYADLFSLEPVDILNRPLRLKGKVREEIINLRQKNGKINFNKHDQLNHHKKVDEIREKVYDDVWQWDLEKLWENISIKQIEVDNWMEELAKRLKIDTSNEKMGILADDQTTKLDEWKAYYIYLCYLIDYGRRIKRLIKIAENDIQEQQRRKGNNIIEQYEAFLYKLIFRKAIGDVNEIYHIKNGFFSPEKILQTIWDKLGLDNPVSPFTDYFTPNDPTEDRIWRRYEINEKHYRSMFLNMEKIKMCYSILLKQVNLSKLMKDQLIVAYYPIHDPYQLRHEKKAPIFQSLVKAGLLDELEPTESEKKLSEMFLSLLDEAESADFDEESVEQETTCNIFQPWVVQVDTLRDYFGEKVALYFRFLSFYTYNLIYMSGFAITAQILQNFADPQLASSFNIFFSMIIIVWSTVFIELWKREQVIFSVAYGQQDFEEDEAERPAFQGVYMRSVVNDDINEEYYSPFKRKMKMLFSIFISFIIIGCAIACVFIIFYLKVSLIKCGDCLPKEIILDANSLPATLNSIQIVIFNTIYSIVGDKLNDYENHKILSSYENSLIAKVYMFTFFNTFNSCFFIAFLSSYFEELELCRFSKTLPVNCFTQLSSQISNIFLVNFFKNIPELITPFLKAIAKQKARKIDLKPVLHPFNKIDEFIEDQSLLEPYITNEEVDGSVADYMELVIQFSFLTLFGLSFPASYALALLNNFVEIQVDKMKMLRFSRRPMPAGACNIGTWLLILDVITFIAIFSNAGLIAYTSNSIPDNKIVVFSTLLISFLGIKYFLRFVIPDVPETAMIVNKRHAVAVDKVVKGFQKSGGSELKSAKINFNIGGVIYKEQENQQVDIKIQQPQVINLDDIQDNQNLHPEQINIKLQN